MKFVYRTIFSFGFLAISALTTVSSSNTYGIHACPPIQTTFGVAAAGSLLVTTAYSISDFCDYLGYDCHCKLWKKEAQELLAEIKDYHQNGKISQKLLQTLDRLEPELQDLPVTEQIQMIEQVLEMIFEEPESDDDEMTN